MLLVFLLTSQALSLPSNSPKENENIQGLDKEIWSLVLGSAAERSQESGLDKDQDTEQDANLESEPGTGMENIPIPGTIDQGAANLQSNAETEEEGEENSESSPETGEEGEEGGENLENEPGTEQEGDRILTKQVSPQPDLRQKVAQFPPVTITTDTSSLSPSEAQVLYRLVEAAKLMDPIFNRQAYHNYKELREQLALDTSELGQATLKYFDIMRGPWDRQDHNSPFAVSFPKPLGAGFYPPGLTLEQWKTYIEEHPQEEEALANLVTMVQGGPDQLIPVPYSQAFQQELSSANSLMLQAANLTDDETLRRFLQSRADAFLSDDYYQSDKDWMDLDSKIEITIGPYEVYEDKLKAQKASFEAFLTVTDPVESEKLSLYKSLLPQMEQNLPIEDSMKSTRGAESPIRVVDLVFSSGEARKSVQTIAFNLPNDERVRKEKGAKKVMLKNVISAKFEGIMTPIAQTLMKKKQLEQDLLSATAFFNNVLFHELSHSLGPAFVHNNESEGEVRAALGASYSGLEEAKADVMGVYNILYMVQLGHMPKHLENKSLFTYISGLFRSIRFGVSEAHGAGAALQLNRYLEEGAVTYLEAEQAYQVNFAKLRDSVTALVRDICTWQHNGSKAVVDSVMEKYTQLSPLVKDSLARLNSVPVDIQPCYPLAGETCDNASNF